jgi:hypothetical protein
VKFVGKPLGSYLVVGIVIFLIVISHVSCGDMARSCDSSHVSAGRDDGTPSLLRQYFGVCVPALLHGSHVPTKHARNILYQLPMEKQGYRGRIVAVIIFLIITTLGKKSLTLNGVPRMLGK